MSSTNIPTQGAVSRLCKHLQAFKFQEGRDEINDLRKLSAPRPFIHFARAFGRHSFFLTYTNLRYSNMKPSYSEVKSQSEENEVLQDIKPAYLKNSKSTRSFASTSSIIDIKSEHASDALMGGTQPEYMPFRQFILVFTGLAMAMFMASLCATVVTVALGKMAADMNDMVDMAWIATSYMLTSTAFSPVWGKFSDVFGRKFTLMAAAIIFMIGSLLCALAENMIMLIIARAVQGVGGGAMMSLVAITIADLVPLRDTPKYQGLIGGVFSISSVLGPILGGVFVDHATWRWAFWMQLPLGLFSVICFLLFLKPSKKTVSAWEKLARIDYGGIFSLLIAVVALLLALSWGGQTYAWNSTPVISLFVVSGVFICITIFVEIKVAKDPICPPHLFMNRNLVSLYVSSFFTGFGFYALLFYLPIFYQETQQESATAAGIEMLPLILGLSVCSILSGTLISKTGRFRIFIWIGTIMLTVGCALISTMTQFSGKAMQVGYLLIAGFGMGFVLQTLVVAGQATVERKDLALVTSLLTFWRTIGGVLGTAICGTIYQNALASNLMLLLDPATVAKITTSAGIVTAGLAPHELSLVIEAYAVSLQLVYRTFMVYTALAFLASLFLKHVEMGSSGKSKKVGIEVIEETKTEEMKTVEM